MSLNLSNQGHILKYLKGGSHLSHRSHRSHRAHRSHRSHRDPRSHRSHEPYQLYGGKSPRSPGNSSSKLHVKVKKQRVTKRYPKYREALLKKMSKLQPDTKVWFFYDNDRDNFADRHLCRPVIPVKIRESTTLADGNMVVPLGSYQQYCQKLRPAAKRFGLQLASLGEGDSYDPRAGLRKQQLLDYRVLCENYPIGGIIFDWDRTLTVIEGVYAIKPTVLEMLRSLGLIGVRVRDVAEFYFGGQRRIEYLRRFFNVLRDRKIPIWILSSNPAIERTPQFFLDLLTSCGLAISPHHLIYRGSLTKFQYIKKYIIPS